MGLTDQTNTKRRPAVIVSSDAYHRERPDLIILAITSQARPQAALGEAAVAKWKEAGLLRPSGTLGRPIRVAVGSSRAAVFRPCFQGIGGIHPGVALVGRESVEPPHRPPHAVESSAAYAKPTNATFRIVFAPI